MTKRILWIEDNVFDDLQFLTPDIYLSGKYDLTIALTASDGLQQILNSEYDILIFDIRILPGSNPNWINLYNQYGNDSFIARLGLHLLYSLLSPETAKIKLKSIPTWIVPRKIGVFTIEPAEEIGEHLHNLGITHYLKKSVLLKTTALLDFIEEILIDKRELFEK